MKLKGNNLGERHQDLNRKINDAVSKKIDSAAMRDAPVDTDVDQLFKIDIASHLKDVPFLLEMLVSGDSLYITRVLKSVWLFDDEYQLIISPDYLSTNIFPQMSSKMMKKFLTTASIWIRNEGRAEKFYLYCKENGMPNIATKFLVSTAEIFKESVLNDDFEMMKDLKEDMFQFIIGSSFKLADLYLSKSSQKSLNRILHQLRFLYSVDNEKYLDILENNYVPDTCNSHRFGLRISKDIFKIHKERILKHPLVYATTLNILSIAKHSNSVNAKSFLTVLLPDGQYKFWGFMNRFEFLIKIIPLTERHAFLKKIYKEKYGSEFEMNREFYDHGYYKYMTEAQQEIWALDQLASKKEILGAGNDFLCYKFIKFDKAFEDIKKLILITTNDNKRLEMLSVLVKSAKNLTELEKLLNYFYVRHGNEMVKRKNAFLDSVISHHNIFSFDQHCWNAFNKILYNLDIYNAQNFNYSRDHKLIAVLYPILHGMELPEVLRSWVMDQFTYIPFDMEIKIKQFAPNGPDAIYKRIMQVYLEELYNLENKEYDDKVRMKARDIIYKTSELRNMFDKKDDVSEIVTKFMKLDPETFYPKPEKRKKSEELEPELNPATPQEFMRMLKKDATLASNFDLLELSIQYAWKYNIKELLNKIRIYFHDDIALKYMEYFKKTYINKSCRLIYVSVFGILILADPKFKTEFILHYVPDDSEVLRKYRKVKQIDESVRTKLYIRKAICRFACYSRPPIENDNILKYIRGNYLKYCLPMFNVYMMRHPPVFRFRFVNSLLDRPEPIKKYALRLAFRCFSSEDLTNLILTSWKTQSMSLRKIIYEYVFLSVQKQEATRKDMFELLKNITLDLKEDECIEVTKNVSRFVALPHELKGFYLGAVWTSLSMFADSESNVEIKTDIIRQITRYIDDIPKEIVKKVVSVHIEESLVKYKIKSYDDMFWSLTRAFICKYCKDEDILEFVKFIIQKCVDRWNETHFDYECNKYVFQKFCYDFINSLINRSYYSNKNTLEFNRVLESILANLTIFVPKHEIFVVMLNLKVIMLTNRVLDYACSTYSKCAFDEEEFDDIAKEYVKELENFMKYMIQNKSFSIMFTSFLSDIIVSNVRSMAQHLCKAPYVYEKLIILIASNLTDLSMVEKVMLAVALSPAYCRDEDRNIYGILKNRLAKIENVEIKCLLKIKYDSTFY